MFAPVYAPRAASAQMLSGLYRQVGVETSVTTANSHQLVLMLYDGLLEALVQARGALRDKQIEAKGKAITKAARIVDEGLKAALSPAGGELSRNLGDLYTYISMRLMHAHLRNDDAALEECQRLIQPLREAWVAIGSQVHG